MKKRTLFQKLLASHLLIGVSTVLLVAYFFYHSFKSALIERTVAQLTSINVLKQAQLEDYFRHQRRNIQLLAAHPALVELVQQRQYPVPTSDGESAPLDQDPRLVALQQEFGYQDLLLLDTELHVLYQQTRSFRFPADAGPQAAPLQQFLRNSLRQSLLSEISFPGESQPVILLSVPLRGQGQPLGVLLVRLPLSQVEYTLHMRTGLGQTGESYIVGRDLRMRSTSRFFPNRAPAEIQVRTEAANNAFANRSEPHILQDYRGVPVLSAYHALTIEGLEWAIISEIDMEEAMLPVYQVRQSMVWIGIGVCWVIAMLTWFVSFSLSLRMTRLREIMLKLARGILPAQPLHVSDADEIGQMKNALNEVIAALRRTATFAHDVGNGNFTAHYEPLSPEDTLGNSLVQMRDKLRTSQERETYLSRQRTAALLEGQENERRRISRELHDGVGQLLTATQFKVGLIEGQDNIRKEIKMILDETVTEIRRISHNLMPSVLLDFGLEAALKSLCNRTAQATGLSLEFDWQHAVTPPPALPGEAVTGLYRIAQEAVHNAVRHAGARRIGVRVRLEPNRFELCIEDDGRGFVWDGFAPETRLETRLETNGLRNMRERTELLGGTLQLTSRPGEGTRLFITIPLSSTTAA